MISDNEIIALFFNRSPNAIKELSDKYEKDCNNLSYRILKNDCDAQECVNDSYLAVWNTVPPNRPNPLKTYLLKIVRNISLSKYKHNTARKRNSYYDASLEELENVICGNNSVEIQVEKSELTGYINKFLDSLSKEDRVIFVKRYWFCEPYSAISSATGLSEKNVSVRLTRLRKNLKRFLEKEGVLI